MLKFEGKFSVGQTIRAYDFMPREGVEDRFVEGKIKKILGIDNSETGFGCYVIVAEKDTAFKKNGGRVGEEVYVPFEVSFMEYDERVQAL